MYCKFCGKENDENALFCSNCGHKLREEVKTEIIDNNNPTEAKCWSVFALIGKIVGIVSIAMCIFPYFSAIIAVYGIVFSALGKKSKIKKAMDDSSLGLVLSIVAEAVCIIATVVWLVVFTMNVI